MRAVANHKHLPGPTLKDSFAVRFARVLDRLVFCCLLSVIVVTTIPYGTVDSWWDAVFEAAVFSLAAFSVTRAFVLGAVDVKRLLVVLPLLAITAYMFLQTLEMPRLLSWSGGGPIVQHTLSIDPYQTFLTALKTLALTLFFGLLVHHVSSPQRFKWLIRVVVGLGLASAIFALIRQLLQSPQSTSGFILSYLFYGFGYGVFLSPNVFAYQAEMCLAIIAGLALGGGVNRSRMPIYLSIALVVWGALVLSNSRGGIFAFVCEFIFIIVVSLRWYLARRFISRGDQSRLVAVINSKVARLAAVALIIATVAVGVLWMGGDRLASKLSATSATSGDDILAGTNRSEVWRSTYSLIKKNPVTGVGFGAYYLAIPQYQVGSGRLKVEQAHNDYLDLTASGGVVGLALVGLFGAMVAWRAISASQSEDAFRRAACLGAAAAVIAAAVHSMVDFGLQITGIAVYFAAILQILTAGKDVETSRRKRRGASSRAS